MLGIGVGIYVARHSFSCSNHVCSVYQFYGFDDVIIERKAHITKFETELGGFWESIVCMIGAWLLEFPCLSAGLGNSKLTYPW